MRLLLIDDDDLDRMMVCRLLRGGGDLVDIVEANTGRRGLQLFDESEFDAVLLDFMLPDMGGLEVLGALQRHLSRRSAVIMLTGSDNRDLELQCIDAGAQDFLLKHEISARHLRRALLHARARHQLESRLLESHKALQHLAERDTLTGIANRYYFDKHLRLAVAESQQTSGRLALLLLDIDNFKLVNDSLGHVAGDQILRGVAQRLTDILPPDDIVCRLGGDEFAIIVREIDSGVGVVDRVHQIQAALRAPYRVNNYDLCVSFSIGISVCPDNGATSDDIFKFADLAMYVSKRDGRDCFHFFAETLNQEATRKAEIERDLRSPHLLEQLELFYQPLFDAASLRICGAEALVRWNHPRRGRLAPGEFIDIAQEFGLMNVIDAWSRQEACRQMAAWLRRGLTPAGFRMTFNACAATLKQQTLPADILHEMRTNRLPDGAVELEVTESDLVVNFRKTATILNEIKGFGMDIAVDDFGTGYSSMAYLKSLPASTLKIDRAFLAGVPECEADCRILRAMIVMAKDLGLRVIVEGVETAGQAETCRSYGADVLQGYYFARPLPARQFEAEYGLRGTAERTAGSGGRPENVAAAGNILRI